MHKSFYALCGAGLALLGNFPAAGADLPKAVLKAPTDLYSVGGWYMGVGTEAVTAQANTSGNALFVPSLIGGNLKASGGAVKGVLGYIGVTPTTWYRIEGSAAWQNITGSNTVAGGSAGVASRWSATQEVDVGIELFKSILAFIPNLGLNFPTFTPVSPSGVSGAAPRQYVGIGVREFGVEGTFGVANGSSWSAAPMAKTGFLWQSVGADGKPTGSAVDVYAWASSPMRGISLNNVFAANGTPLAIGTAVNMGTQYGAGANYLFRF